MLFTDLLQTRKAFQHSAESSRGSQSTGLLRPRSAAVGFQDCQEGSSSIADSFSDSSSSSSSSSCDSSTHVNSLHFASTHPVPQDPAKAHRQEPRRSTVGGRGSRTSMARILVDTTNTKDRPSPSSSSGSGNSQYSSSSDTESDKNDDDGHHRESTRQLIARILSETDAQADVNQCFRVRTTTAAAAGTAYDDEPMIYASWSLGLEPPQEPTAAVAAESAARRPDAAAAAAEAEIESLPRPPSVHMRDTVCTQTVALLEQLRSR